MGNDDEESNESAKKLYHHVLSHQDGHAVCPIIEAGSPCLATRAGTLRAQPCNRAGTPCAHTKGWGRQGPSRRGKVTTHPAKWAGSHARAGHGTPSPRDKYIAHLSVGAGSPAPPRAVLCKLVDGRVLGRRHHT
jgi:hypothetical protein